MPLHINDKTHKGRRMLRELTKTVQRAQGGTQDAPRQARAPRKPLSSPRPGTLAWAVATGWQLECDDDRVQARKGERVTGWLAAGPDTTQATFYAAALEAAAAMEDETHDG